MTLISLLISLVWPSFAWANPATPTDRLTQDEALARSQWISRVDIDFAVDLTQAEQFSGEATIRFNVREKTKHPTESSFVELEAAEIESVQLNGENWKPIEIQDRYKNNRLRLPTGDLGAKNTLVIKYHRPYRHDGVGLHRFEDPTDQSPYLYTHFEPYHAHSFIPCFDQPDLKTVFRAQVTVPKDWTVFHNSIEEKVESLPESKHKRWTFKSTPRMSSYLLAVIAGPFQVWKSTAKVGEVTLPMRLAARKSVAKYVNTAEWLSITRKGLDFYSLFFGVEYPFGKYDQILVPEFSMGAMENLAAVTFNEGYAFRSEPTAQQKGARDDTILHEMAHQWFGNLVTMKWWNGLWLNESFATWAAHRAREEIAPESQVWKQFYNRDKRSAYRADALETSHPVDQAAATTADALASFDEITYGKGASVLKQLAFLVGDEDFREGLQRYFSIYAYRNTQLADFYRKIGEASDRDLSSWSKAWLQTTGTDRLKAEWKCEEEHISKLLIRKMPANSTRQHRTAVGLYRAPRSTHAPWQLLRKPKTDRSGRNSRRTQTSDEIELPYSFAVTVQGAENQIPEAIGFPCPDHILLNEEDQDFAITDWKPSTLEAFAQNPMRVTAPLNRIRLWQDLWESVESRTTTPELFLKAIQTQLPLEKDAEIASAVLGVLVSGKTAHLGSPGPLEYFTTPEQRTLWAKKLETWSREKWRHFPAGSDLRKIWFQAALGLSTTPAGQRWISGFFAGKTPTVPTGLDWTTERKWNALFHLSRLGGHPKMNEWIEKLATSDPSDFGKRAQWLIQAVAPGTEAKQTLFHQWIGREGDFERLSNFRAVAQGLITSWHLEQIDPLLPYALEQLAQWGAQNTDGSADEFAAVIAEDFIPARCEATYAEMLRKFLKEHPDLKPIVSKPLRETAQKSAGCSIASIPKRPDNDLNL